MRRKHFCLFLFIVLVFLFELGQAVQYGCVKNNKSQGFISFFDEEYPMDALRLRSASEYTDDNQKILNAYFDEFMSGNEENAVKYLEQLKILTKSTEEERKPIRTTPEIIRGFGYPAEVHNVTTQDGYILSLYRLYSPKNNTRKGIPVLMLHGLFESSNGWIVQGPSKSLAFMLADAGYDVWLANARGTKDSRKHIKLDAMGNTKRDYWAYSWHEIGRYDLPANIDYVLKTTGQQKLHYVGFSQGTTSLFVCLSQVPQYNEKIISANLLAPVASLRNIPNVGNRVLSYLYKPVKYLLEYFKIYFIDIDNKLLVDAVETVCKRTIKGGNSPICTGILYLLESKYINCSLIPHILEHVPAGISTQQFYHYMQFIRTGLFRQYDYENLFKNLKAYGKKEPPVYDLRRVTVPTVLYYSPGDLTANERNVLKIPSLIRNVIETYKVSDYDFTHIDFIYSVYVRERVNEKVLATIQKNDGLLYN